MDVNRGVGMLHSKPKLGRLAILKWGRRFLGRKQVDGRHKTSPGLRLKQPTRHPKRSAPHISIWTKASTGDIPEVYSYYDVLWYEDKSNLEITMSYGAILAFRLSLAEIA